MPRLPRNLVWPLACFAAAWGISQTGIGQQLEWRTVDWRTQLRAFFQGPPDPRIAVVLYEDSTDSAVAWPPDRQVHGSLVELMSFEKPAVVTFDVMLDAEREGDGDALMVAGISAAAEANVKFISGATTGTDDEVPAESEGPTQPLPNVTGDISLLDGDERAPIKPFPLLRGASLYGFVNAEPDSSGMRREIPLVVRVGKAVYPSLSLQTLMAFLDVKPADVRVVLGEAIYLGDRRIPVNRSGRYLLNYRYDQDEQGNWAFPTYSYLEMLVRLQARHVEKNPAARAPNIAGRIVFVGQVVTGKADVGPTPLSGLSPLVLIHANLVNNVLASDFVRVPPAWLVWLVAIAIGYSSVFTRQSIWLMVLLAVLVTALYVALGFAAWIRWSLWLPLTGPVLGFVISEFVLISRRALSEKRARDQVKQMFGTYLSPMLVDRLVKSGQQPRLGGHQAEITAYFSDIQGFSSFSEKLEPDRLVELMNEYLTVCTDIVQDEGGTLDKYIGDAVVAMFGAPVAQKDHAFRACVAAIRAQEAIVRLREKWRGEPGWPEIVLNMRSRIGLNTGKCIIGNMGSRRRFNYTMMGDDVNLAARMESGAKSWGVYCLCTESTRAACERDGGDRVVFRSLGRIVVMGRAAAVPIHEIVGLKESVSQSATECIRLFEEGLGRYYERDWEGALGRFERSREMEPFQPGRDPGVKTNPSLIYIGLCRGFNELPPPAGWDGVYVMTEK